MKPLQETMKHIVESAPTSVAIRFYATETGSTRPLFYFITAKLKAKLQTPDTTLISLSRDIMTTNRHWHFRESRLDSSQQLFFKSKYVTIVYSVISSIILLRNEMALLYVNSTVFIMFWSQNHETCFKNWFHHNRIGS